MENQLDVCAGQKLLRFRPTSCWYTQSMIQTQLSDTKWTDGEICKVHLKCVVELCIVSLTSVD